MENSGEFNEIKALIALLDDTDQEVVDHVANKLLSMGPGVIGILEDAYVSIPDLIAQQRIENIIHSIQFEGIKRDLSEWITGDSDDLLKALFIIHRYRYPLADEDHLSHLVQQIRKEAWLGLNPYLSPIEQMDVLNQTLFYQFGLKGNNYDDEDPQYSFIGHLLEPKKGNHFSLGLLYLAISQQLGLPVCGVLLGSHFILVRCKEELFDFSNNALLKDQVLFYINPYNKGLTFSEREINSFLKKAEIEPDERYFLPASNENVIVEYLQFLSNQFANQKGDWKQADMLELISILKTHGA